MHSTYAHQRLSLAYTSVSHRHLFLNELAHQRPYWALSLVTSTVFVTHAALEIFDTVAEELVHPQSILVLSKWCVEARDSLNIVEPRLCGYETNRVMLLHICNIFG